MQVRICHLLRYLTVHTTHSAAHIRDREQTVQCGFGEINCLHLRASAKDGTTSVVGDCNSFEGTYYFHT
jgi:hypothetical protein